MKTRLLIFAVIFSILRPSISYAKILVSFKGQIDLPQKQFDFLLNFPPKTADVTNSVSFHAQQISEKDYHFSLDINHLWTPFFDLLSKVESSVELFYQDEMLSSSGSGGLRGKVWSEYSLVDYKPVRELSGQFEVKDKRLYLTSLNFGNMACRGYVDLVSPYKLDVAVGLSFVDMNDFLDFWIRGNDYEASGTVSGEIRISGALNRLLLKGSLQSYNGFIQDLEYNSISLNAEGVYPRIQVAPSLMTQSNGTSFILEGAFDLSDQANFKKQIQALTFSPVVRNSASESEWTIKRISQEDTSTAIKYRLRKNEGMGSSVDGSDMLGIERTVEF